MKTIDVKAIGSPLFHSISVQSSVEGTISNTSNDLMDVYAAPLAQFLQQETGCTMESAVRCLQWPNELGDVVAVLPRLKLEGIDAAVLAEELAEKFPESELYAQPFADNFNLRFMFMEDTLEKLLVPFILDRGPSYGIPAPTGSAHAPSKMIVEYSSPNVGREFDGSHLRSTIVGEFLASLHEALGWQVVRMNFVGDWGKHIGLLAAGWTRFGSEEELNRAPHEHLSYLASKTEQLRASKAPTTASCGGSDSVSMQQQIDIEKDDFYKDLENGEIEALVRWKRFRDAAVDEYKKLYSRMGIVFDVYSGESEVSVDSIDEVEEALKAAGVYELSKSAWIVKFPGDKYPGLGVGIGRFRNGTTSYLLRDIAAVLDRKKSFDFDKILYVVAARQDAHFRQLFASLELIGRKDLADQVEHVSFGPVNGLETPPGSNGLLIGNILKSDRVVSRVEGMSGGGIDSDTMAGVSACEICHTTEGTALAVQILAAKRSSAVPFEASGIVTDRGRAGHALYAFFSQLDEAINQRSLSASTKDAEAVHEHAVQEETVAVLRHLIHFPAVVQSAHKSMESSILIAFLVRLVFLMDETPFAPAKSTTCKSDCSGVSMEPLRAARQVLGNGMTILGLHGVSNMSAHSSGGNSVIV